MLAAWSQGWSFCYHARLQAQVLAVDSLVSLWRQVICQPEQTPQPIQLLAASTDAVAQSQQLAPAPCQLTEQCSPAVHGKVGVDCCAHADEGCTQTADTHGSICSSLQHDTHISGPQPSPTPSSPHKEQANAVSHQQQSGHQPSTWADLCDEVVSTIAMHLGRSVTAVMPMYSVCR